MRLKTFSFIAIIFCSTVSLQAQSGGAYEMSKMVLSSADTSKNKISASAENTYMTLNLVTGDFNLRADLSALRSNDSKTDSLLIAAKEQIFLFKGNINMPISEYNKIQNDEKLYDMSGVLSLNGQNLPCVAQFDPINMADKSDPKNYRLDFILNLETAKIKVKGWENVLNKTFRIEVIGGKINIQN